MRFLLPQALAAGRQALLHPLVRSSITQQARLLPAVQAAWVSFKIPVNYEPKPTVALNTSKKLLIATKRRPGKRPFVPPPTKTEDELMALFPYIVRRTPYSQLPVYRRFMSGGNRIVVLVKKIDGDRARLIQDLTKALELKDDEIRLNPTTQQIEIKGDKYEKTKDWLLEAGF